MCVILKHQFAKRGLAVFLLLAMLVASAPSVVYADATLDHLNDQFDKLEQQQQAVRDKLAAAKNEKEKQQAIRDSLKNQIKTTQQQIDVLSNKINYLREEISNQEEELGRLSEEVTAILRIIYVL